jgi:hypothetical protein
MKENDRDEQQRKLRDAVDDGMEYASCVAEIRNIRDKMREKDNYKPIAWIFVALGAGSFFTGNDQIGPPFMVFGLVAALWLYGQHSNKHEVLQRIERLERKAEIVKARIERN